MQKKKLCPACGKPEYLDQWSAAPEFPNEGFCDACGFGYSSEFPQSPDEQGRLYRESYGESKEENQS